MLKLLKVSRSISPEFRVASPISGFVQELAGILEDPEVLIAVVRRSHGRVDRMRLRSAKHRPMDGDTGVGKRHCDDQHIVHDRLQYMSYQNQDAPS